MFISRQTGKRMVSPRQVAYNVRDELAVMETNWLSPNNYTSGDPSLDLSYPYVNHPSTTITSKTVGDSKWVSLSLNLPEAVTIQQVVVCYQLSNARSFIA